MSSQPIWKKTGTPGRGMHIWRNWVLENSVCFQTEKTSPVGAVPSSKTTLLMSSRWRKGGGGGGSTLDLLDFLNSVPSTTQLLANLHLHCCPFSWTLIQKAWLPGSLPPFHLCPSAAAVGWGVILLTLMSSNSNETILELPWVNSY